MEKRKVKLSIIILSWNTKELLRRCLESLISNFEILVVDNASSDGSQKMVEEEFPAVKLIKSNKNLGYAAGNNLGIKYAVGKYIMILNSDTVVKERSIEKLIDFLDTHSDVDFVGPRLINPDGSFQASCGRFPSLAVVVVMLFKEHFGGSEFVRFSPKKSMVVDWLMGAAFMARRNVFEKIDGFDENIFMYMEEIEWFYRAKKAGFKAYCFLDSEIVHLGRGSSKTGKKEPILNIYKGLIYFYKKHKTLPELFALRLMLKTKALAAYLIGLIKDDKYLKETYGEALKIR